mgnify:CR=1 FL=1
MTSSYRIVDEPLQAARYRAALQQKRSRRRIDLGCLIFVIFACLFLTAGSVLALVFLPGRLDFIAMGVDRSPEGTLAGRTDTIILVSVQPRRSYVGMLAVPRDLWVALPGGGENRINTAHFFAEAAQPGSGPQAVREAVKQNFGVDFPYYVRFRFDSVQQVVDAMGGVTITLEEPTALYSAGSHHIDGAQALAFVRDRQGTDDFFRMKHGQVFIRAVIRQFLNPATLPRYPAILSAVMASVDTNIPIYRYPDLAFTLLRVGVENIDSRTITREMVTPFTTDLGAMVLLPRWDIIMPVISEMFPPH